METANINIPSHLTLRDCFVFGARLDLLPMHDRYVIDFLQLQHVPPFGMLFTAAVLRQFIAGRGISELDNTLVFRNFDLNSFAGHMGFFQSVGARYGKRPGEATGAPHYLPITSIDTLELRRRAKGLGLPVAQLVVNESNSLAAVLCQGAHLGFETAIAYSLRELFRNIVEHSGADKIWFCAQHWPQKDLVELAILDEGMGILKSLSTNPELKIVGELDAIRQAIKPGVTRFRPSQAAKDLSESDAWESQSYGVDPSFWQNSGWGLFVTSELSRRSGTFAVISNNVGLILEGKRETFGGTTFLGTAVRVLLKPSQIGKLLRKLLNASGKHSLSTITPSMVAKLGSLDAV